MAGETPVTVVGNLTDDPAMTYIDNGSALVKFSVASTPRYVDRETGQWKDGDALFMNCTAWRDLAEHVAGSLRKGNRVIVYGRLKQSKWTTAEGEKRSAYGVEVDEIGPSLRFAEATVVRAVRSKGRDGFTPDAPPVDVWASLKTSEEAPF